MCVQLYATLSSNTIGYSVVFPFPVVYAREGSALNTGNYGTINHANCGNIRFPEDNQFMYAHAHTFASLRKTLLDLRCGTSHACAHQTCSFAQPRDCLNASSSSRLL